MYFILNNWLRNGFTGEKTTFLFFNSYNLTKKKLQNTIELPHEHDTLKVVLPETHTLSLNIEGRRRDNGLATQSG